MTAAEYRRYFISSFLAVIIIFSALAGFVYINNKAESVLHSPKEITAASETEIASMGGEELHYSLEFLLGLGDIVRGFSPYFALVIGFFVLICEVVSEAAVLHFQHFGSVVFLFGKLLLVKKLI